MPDEMKGSDFEWPKEIYLHAVLDEDCEFKRLRTYVIGNVEYIVLNENDIKDSYVHLTPAVAELELATLKSRCKRVANELRESTRFVFSSGDRNPHCESHLSYTQRQKLANELSPPTTATTEKERE